MRLGVGVDVGGGGDCLVGPLMGGQCGCGGAGRLRGGSGGNVERGGKWRASVLPDWICEEEEELRWCTGGGKRASSGFVLARRDDSKCSGQIVTDCPVTQSPNHTAPHRNQTPLPHSERASFALVYSFGCCAGTRRHHGPSAFWYHCQTNATIIILEPLKA